MTDDSEKRFHSIMDKLFHSPKSTSRSFFVFFFFFPFGSRENKGEDLIENVWFVFFVSLCANIKVELRFSSHRCAIKFNSEKYNFKF